MLCARTYPTVGGITRLRYQAVTSFCSPSLQRQFPRRRIPVTDGRGGRGDVALEDRRRGRRRPGRRLLRAEQRPGGLAGGAVGDELARGRDDDGQAQDRRRDLLNR